MKTPGPKPSSDNDSKEWPNWRQSNKIKSDSDPETFKSSDEEKDHKVGPIKVDPSTKQYPLIGAPSGYLVNSAAGFDMYEQTFGPVRNHERYVIQGTGQEVNKTTETKRTFKVRRYPKPEVSPSNGEDTNLQHNYQTMFDNKQNKEPYEFSTPLSRLPNCCSEKSEVETSGGCFCDSSSPSSGGCFCDSSSHSSDGCCCDSSSPSSGGCCCDSSSRSSGGCFCDSSSPGQSTQLQDFPNNNFIQRKQGVKRPYSADCPMDFNEQSNNIGFNNFGFQKNNNMKPYNNFIQRKQGVKRPYSADCPIDFNEQSKNIGFNNFGFQKNNYMKPYKNFIRRKKGVKRPLSADRLKKLIEEMEINFFNSFYFFDDKRPHIKTKEATQMRVYCHLPECREQCFRENGLIFWKEADLEQRVYCHLPECREQCLIESVLIFGGKKSDLKQDFEETKKLQKIDFDNYFFNENDEEASFEEAKRAPATPSGGFSKSRKINLKQLTGGVGKHFFNNFYFFDDKRSYIKAKYKTQMRVYCHLPECREQCLRENGLMFWKEPDLEQRVYCHSPECREQWLRESDLISD